MTSTFFNNYGDTAEQELLQDLIVEAIHIYGQDMYYIPRNLNDLDTVFEQDDVSSFTKAHLIEVYIKSVNGFDGNGSFLSKFGIEIRDQVTFTVAARTFSTEIPNIIRPRETDLIYFPLNKKCFEIKFVDDKPFFYQFGSLPTYDLWCETFEYSTETFNTGIPEIDAIQKKLSLDVLDYALTDSDGNILTDNSGRIIVTKNYDLEEIDVLQDNIELQERADDVIVFDPNNPFSASGSY